MTLIQRTHGIRMDITYRIRQRICGYDHQEERLMCAGTIEQSAASLHERSAGSIGPLAEGWSPSIQQNVIVYCYKRHTRTWHCAVTCLSTAFKFFLYNGESKITACAVELVLNGYLNFTQVL